MEHWIISALLSLTLRVCFRTASSWSHSQTLHNPQSGPYPVSHAAQPKASKLGGATHLLTHSPMHSLPVWPTEAAPGGKGLPALLTAPPPGTGHSPKEATNLTRCRE